MNVPSYAPNMDYIKHIHFIGIGGSGMGGIAEVLLNQGYKITGSDVSQNAITQRLRALNVPIKDYHASENIRGADIVVVSTAIAEENPEVLAAKQARIPVIPRALMLAELMRLKYGIAIAGTHGKTTTTSLVASILAEGGCDPTFVIGGLLKSAGKHAHLGQGEFFVAEADESDASFLYLLPQITIVTNIDADHLGTYGGDFTKLRQTFIQFLHRLPFNGLAVICLDDPVIQQIISEIARPIITYGFNPDADIQITQFTQAGTQTHFKLNNKITGKTVNIELNLPGKHNASNAAAAYAVANHLNISETAIQKALTKFAGVGRRFQIHGEFNIDADRKVLLVDDYGHHPREINVTLEAARAAWPNRRLVIAYQPHRYTRTQELFQDFVEVLSKKADLLILLDIYAAGEKPIENISGESLYTAIKPLCKTIPHFVKDIHELPKTLLKILQNDDVLLLQGAGSIGAMVTRLANSQMRLVELIT